MAAARMGRIEVAQTPTTLLLTVVVVVAVAVLGAVGPAHAAVRTPAVEAVRDTASEGRRRMGMGRWILFKSKPEAPRVIITNDLLVGEYDNMKD